MKRLNEIALSLAAIVLWCFAFVWIGDFPMRQGILLGLVTAWLLFSMFGTDFADLWALSNRSSSFSDRAKVLLLKLAAVAFGCLALVFAGGFSTAQSVLLGVVLSFLVAGLAERTSKPAWRFYPYHVRIVPNWYKLLSDFKIVGTHEELSELLSASQSSNSDRQVLRHGISFTVIEQSKSLDHALVFANGGYRSMVEFDFDLSPIRVERIDSLSGFPNMQYQRVHLFLEPAGVGDVAGYSLGISVPMSWWKIAGGSCPVPLRESAEDATGYVKLVIAAISYREFELYWKPTEWSDKFLMTTSKAIKEIRDEHREKFGWAPEQLDEDSPFTMHFNTIEHKYFCLTHGSI